MPEELLDELWVACRELTRDEAFGIHAGLGDVAFLLGFTDANAFSRAFKRWTGEPPSHFKRAG
jgi:AraC-like DNA-binding protein